MPVNFSELMRVISGHMHACVMANIHDKGKDVPGGWPATKMFPGKQLMGKGNLLRSIQMKSSLTDATVFTNQKGARLMHYGGVVKAKKMLGSVKRKQDVYAMEQFFWAMYYKNKKNKNLWMALARHVHAHGQITVKARPYMVLTDPYRAKIIDAIKKYAFS